MTQDPNRKSPRQFQCREYLWDIYQRMSSELDCSVDYLINEAMRQYARSQDYGSEPPGPRARQGGGIPPLASGPPVAAPPHVGAPGVYPPPPAPGRTYPPPSQGGYAPPSGYHPPSRHPSSLPPPPAPSLRGAPSVGPPPLPRSRPVPAAAPQAAAAGGVLSVVFNGQKIPIQKSEFVIGRGSKTADLPIKDGNISRRHAAVVFQDGQYYIKDLGSTNGVEYGGRRVDTKRIQEGDLFRLCDYELRFTYR